MKKVTLILAAAIALVSGLFAPKSAEAVPAFARQVGVPCFSCHYQHVPKLNAFGREFMLGGYTQTAQDLISDEGVSLPPVLNAAFVVKMRYVSSTYANPLAAGDVKNGDARGRLDVPDEAAAWFAGRVAENWGAAVEFPGPTASLKLIYSKNFGGVQGGLSVSTTDALGAAWSMEPFNTGGTRGRRQFENRGATLAQSALGGPGYGASTGIHIFASSPMFFVNVGLFGPATSLDGGPAIDTGFDLSTYYRLAITPKVADGLDLMIGLQGSSGQTKLTGNADQTAGTTGLAVYKTDTMVLDVQVQTEVAGMSLEVVAAYLSNKACSLTTGGVDTEYCAYGTASSSTQGDEKGYNLGVSLGLSKEMGVKFSVANADSGTTGVSAVSAFAIGAWYDFAQNVDLQLEYASYSGGSVDGSTTKARDFDSQLLALLLFAF